MIDSHGSPQIDIPPVVKTLRAESKTQRFLKRLGPVGAFIAMILAKAQAAIPFLFAAVKFLKLGKILLTSGSMLLSVWVYAQVFGWPLAFGFVILIFIHEMGHVYVGWRQGMSISAPIFIPGMGALILQRTMSKSAWEQAIMGIGGPIGGAIGSTLCWAIYLDYHNPIFRALAYLGFFLNLFNLIPIVPLDGGWIVGAIAPWLWIAGLMGILGLTVSGFIRNPMIFILILLSLPTVWTMIKSKGRMPGTMEPATNQQRFIMGLAYVSLAAFLAFGMGATHLQTTGN